MKSLAVLLFACMLPASGADRRPQLRPPLAADADDRNIPGPGEHQVSELYAIVHNSWFRHLNPADKAAAARDSGALNVNAWDEVPDSSWFTNRIGRHGLSFDEICAGLEGRPPEKGAWGVLRVEDEGYTPKLRVRDAAGRVYILKFDPSTPEKNSGAERISTLVLHAAGYNVPRNTIVVFRPSDLVLTDGAFYIDAIGKRRPLTAADLEAVLHKITPLHGGSYRGLASLFLPGKGAGKFKYTGTRKDDPNDIIPHERRRELRGLRVIAAWINHADSGDKNTYDAYVTVGERGYLKHYLLDFGSSLGSGDYINGPFRVGHEYIFDGSAMSRSFVTLGLWHRPWEVRGRIAYPEIGYYDSELFEPEKWKPNYPNLAFVRMDDADGYWGAKIVTAFSDELIESLAQAGEYSRGEVTAYLAETLKRRRDAIGKDWLDRVAPLEEFVLADGRLTFRDLAVERGYAPDEVARRYRLRVDGVKGPLTFVGRSVQLPELNLKSGGEPDRYGRLPLARVRIESKRCGGGWSLPVEVTLGQTRDSRPLQVLGWRHAVR
ncbi:MAG TPA: hypothetical protein VLX58_01610 [Bryobacteraceae bacterium]|nr:hypothetical protein [Bryobacteraceae bacterium]